MSRIDLKLLFVGPPGGGKTESCGTLLKGFGEADILRQNFRGNYDPFYTSINFLRVLKINGELRDVSIQFVEIHLPMSDELMEVYNEANEENALVKLEEHKDKFIHFIEHFKMLLNEGISAIIFVDNFMIDEWTNIRNNMLAIYFKHIIPDELVDRCMLLMTHQNEFMSHYISPYKQFAYLYNYCKNMQDIIRKYKRGLYPPKIPVIPFNANIQTTTYGNKMCQDFIVKLATRWQTPCKIKMVPVVAYGVTNVNTGDNMGTIESASTSAKIEELDEVSLYNEIEGLYDFSQSCQDESGNVSNDSIPSDYAHEQKLEQPVYRRQVKQSSSASYGGGFFGKIVDFFIKL